MMQVFFIKTHLTITQDNWSHTKTSEGSNVFKKKKKKKKKYAAFLFLVYSFSQFLPIRTTVGKSSYPQTAGSSQCNHTFWGELKSELQTPNSESPCILLLPVPVWTPQCAAFPFTPLLPTGESPQQADVRPFQDMREGCRDELCGMAACITSSFSQWAGTEEQRREEG